MFYWVEPELLQYSKHTSKWEYPSAQHISYAEEFHLLYSVLVVQYNKAKGIKWGMPRASQSKLRLC